MSLKSMVETHDVDNPRPKRQIKRRPRPRLTFDQVERLRESLREQSRVTRERDINAELRRRRIAEIRGDHHL